MISGKLELTIKINELPEHQVVENNWINFSVDCDGVVVSVTVKPKMWKKITDANEKFPLWIAAIAGSMGDRAEGGFVLDNPNIQVFERKPKAEKEAG